MSEESKTRFIGLACLKREGRDTNEFMNRITTDQNASNVNGNVTSSTEKSTWSDMFGRTSKWIYSILEKKFMKSYITNQKYIHCEVLFPSWMDEDNALYMENDTSRIALSMLTYLVTKESGVIRKHRTFDNKNSKYDFFYVSVSDENLMAAKSFADQQVGKPFDYIGAKRAIIAPRPHFSSVNGSNNGGNSNKQNTDVESYTSMDGLDSYWCLSLSACIFKRISVIKYLSPTALDIDDLAFLIGNYPNKPNDVYDPSIISQFAKEYMDK